MASLMFLYFFNFIKYENEFYQIFDNMNIFCYLQGLFIPSFVSLAVPLALLSLTRYFSCIVQEKTRN